MTSEEFNEKYKAYIEPGFGEQGLGFDIPEATEFLDKVFQELINIPGFNYSQIKSKFGTSRFYTNLSKVLGHFCSYEICMKIEEKLSFYLKVDDFIRKRDANRKNTITESDKSLG